MRFQLLKSILPFCFLFAYSNYNAKAQENYGKKIVKKLSSRSFRGRGYVQKGDKKTAIYLEKQLAKNKLLPFPSNNKYYQPYTVSVNYFPSKMKFKLGKMKLKPGIDYLVDAASPSIKGKYFIVTGHRKELLDSTDLFTLINKAKNSFLYFDNRIDSTESTEEKEIINQNLHYLQADSSLPIKGIILYSPDKLTWTVLSSQRPKPLVYLHKYFAQIPSTIIINETAKLDTAYQTQNLVGYYKGTICPDSFLVITAHYDHLGKMGKHTTFWGANDNASGTGFLMSLMYFFKQHPPKYSIAFILFSGEELGLKGSEYFTQNPLFDLKKIKFLWNFDMAGTGKTGIQIVNSTIFTHQFSILDSINKSQHLLADIKLRGAASNSDHYWFYKQGIPCFFSYTLGGLNYHDVNDTYKSLPFDAWENYLKLTEIFINSVN